MRVILVLTLAAFIDMPALVPHCKWPMELPHTACFRQRCRHRTDSRRRRSLCAGNRPRWSLERDGALILYLPG